METKSPAGRLQIATRALLPWCMSEGPLVRTVCGLAVMLITSGCHRCPCPQATSEAYSVALAHSDGATENADKDLRALAVKHGIVPEDADHAYFRRQVAVSNSIPMWVLMDRTSKTKVVDQVKEMFRRNDGKDIRRSSEYYVDTMNLFLTLCIQQGEVTPATGKGVGAILRAIAEREDDFLDMERE